MKRRAETGAGANVHVQEIPAEPSRSPSCSERGDR